MNKKFFTLIMLVAVMFTFSAPQAMALTESQISAILGLLSAFDAGSDVIDAVDDALRGKTITSITGGEPTPSLPGIPAPSNCVALTYNMYVGDNDFRTGGEVTKLQTYLTSTGHYIFGRITGYYGPATERAVQKYQRSEGIVSSGTAVTTGYGAVGPATRKYIQTKTCGSITSTTEVIIKTFIYDGEGGSYKLSWDASGPQGTTCLLETRGTLNYGNIATNLPLVGAYIVSPKERTTYDLKCSLPEIEDPSDFAQRSVTVNPTTDNTLGTYKWTLGGGYGHTNNISRADALTNCKLNHKNNPNTSIYCSWNGDEIFSYDPATKPIIDLFTITTSWADSPILNSTIPEGESVRLTWKSSNSKYCYITFNNFLASENRNLPTSGSIIRTPAESGTYTLSCFKESTTTTGKDPYAAIASVEIYLWTSESTIPSITVTSPNGGEEWKEGTLYNPSSLNYVTWTMPDDRIYHVELFLMPQGSTPVITNPPLPGTSGVMIHPVVGGYGIGSQTLTRTTSQSSYTWAIGSQYPKGTYKIRAYLMPKEVSIFDSSKVLAQDESDATFNIVATTFGAPATPTCTLTADKTIVYRDGLTTPIKLTWTSTNADTVSGVGLFPDEPVNGELNISLFTSNISSRTYNYTFTGSGGTATCSVTITILDPTSEPTATLNSTNQYSTSATPVISGTVTGANKVGVALSSTSGDKVYGSGDVYALISGQWAVVVNPALPNGTYTVTVYVNNQVATTGTLTVNNYSPTGPGVETNYLKNIQY